MSTAETSTFDLDRVLREIDDVVFAIAFNTVDGHVIYGQNTSTLGERLPTIHGIGELTFRVEAVNLLEGTYPLTIAVHLREGSEVLAWREQHEHVDVVNREGAMAWGVADLPVEIDLSGVA